jgi:hypothetical protein
VRVGSLDRDVHGRCDVDDDEGAGGGEGVGGERRPHGESGRASDDGEQHYDDLLKVHRDEDSVGMSESLVGVSGSLVGVSGSPMFEEQERDDIGELHLAGGA